MADSTELLNIKPTLDKITEYSSMFMKQSDIAYLIDMDPDEFRRLMADKHSMYYIAYQKGKMLTKVALHEQERKLALVGSPYGVENMTKNLLEMEDDEA